MAKQIEEILHKYLQSTGESKHFHGDFRLEEDRQATVLLAEQCRFYIIDVEEADFEGLTTCYNCR